MRASVPQTTQQDRVAFQSRFDVSRETMARLDAYAALLTRWQKKINLVGPKTIETLWSRHLWDSAQLIELLPTDMRADDNFRILDIGSGAGLPGLVIAAMTGVQVLSVESDSRKIAFQRQACLAIGCQEKVVLHNKRVEGLEPQYPNVMTARAFAPLHKVFELSYPHAKADTLWILPKGQNVGDELKEATKCWTFHVKQVHSETDGAAKLLVIHSVERTQ